MPRKAKIRPDEPGREKILEAARAQFGERGYDGTSIAEIGQRAGISKSVLYHYFGSKAGLYQALLEHDGRELIEVVAAAVPPPGVDTPRLRPVGLAVDERDEQAAEVAELLVDDGAGDARLGGDAVDGGGMEALGVDDRVRDVEDLLATVGGPHASPGLGADGWHP